MLRPHSTPHRHRSSHRTSLPILSQPQRKLRLILETPLKNDPPGPPDSPDSPKPGQPALRMAEAKGESKISEVEPGAGPKRHPLKQTPPVKTREYYNSKLPGTSKLKTKAPSRSPSVEPTDQPDPPTEVNSITTDIQPQEQNVIMERPITPISNTPPPN